MKAQKSFTLVELMIVVANRRCTSVNSHTLLFRTS